MQQRTPLLSGLFALLLLCLIGVPETVRAQQYNFVQYSVQHGLASSQVKAVCQDRNGYLWIGGYGGLSRFDGQTFKKYSTLDGLLHIQVNVIEEDSAGNLWIGTKGGITKITGTIITSFPFPSEGSGSEYSAVDIAFDKEGGLWIASDGAGFYSFKNGEFKQFHTPLFNPENQWKDHVRAVHYDQEDRVWVCTPKGIYRLENEVISQVETGLGFTPNASNILETDQHIWVTSYRGGLLRYNDTTWTVYTTEDGLVSNWVRGISQDRLGHLWIATRYGANIFDGTNFRTFTSLNGMQNHDLWCIQQDMEGNMWFGTDGGGLLRFRDESFATYTTQDGMSSNLIMSIVEDSAGYLWFSTYGKGITRQTDTGYAYYDNLNVLNHNRVWSSLLDSENQLWFGTSDGVTRYSKGEFETWSIREGLVSKRVTSLLEDSKGRLWIGAKGGLSLMTDTAFINFTEADDIKIKNIRAMGEDEEGNIWLATVSGVFRYDGETFQNFNTESGISDNTVVSIAKDPDNRLWFGTDNGLTYLKDGKFEHIKVDDLYLSNITNFLVFDRKGDLWVGTLNGIYRMNWAAFELEGKTEFFNYGLLNGLNDLECNQNAAFMDSKGKLWFGTGAGLTRYDPDMDLNTSSSYRPKVYINNVQLFLEDPDWTNMGFGLDPATGLPIKLTLKADQNHISFDYVGISFANPAQVRYQYRILGISDKWFSTKADFSNNNYMPHGQFTFEVKAVDKNGMWSEEPARFSFEILPPFYLTWWFLLLVGFTLAGVVFFVIRWRWQVARRQAERNQLIFQSKMLGLEQQTLNTSMNRHFIFNALNSIQYYINRQDKLKANMYLANFAKLVRKNLDSTQKNMISLSEELERLELYLALEHMRFSDKFTYKIHVDGQVDKEEIQIPSMLLQPFVENSIRHGILPMDREGEIKVEIKYQDNAVVFWIEDNGIGINTSMASKNLNGQDHVSHGMEITEERINLLRKMTQKNFRIVGPYELKDDEDRTQGTRVEIILPLEHNYSLN